MREKRNFPRMRFPGFGAEWAQKNLHEVAKISSGGTPSRGKPEYWGGSIPWVTTSLINFNEIDKTEEFISELGLANSSAKLFDRGTILMAMYGQGQTRGRVATLAIDATSNQACAGIQVNGEVVTTRFVFLYFERYYEQLREAANAGGQKNLSLGLISNFGICFPSIEEQQKIATFLTTVDRRIKLLQKQKEQLELYKKGLMQGLFSQQIRFKDENGNDFPDWEEKKLGEACEVSKGKQLNKDALTEDGKYPCQNGGIDPSGYTEKYNYEANTITISEGGNSCGYVNYLRTKFWCGGHCYAIVEVKKEIDNTFLFYFLKSQESDLMKLRVGSGLPNIQKKDIVKFSLLFPSIKEQQKIASFLSSLDNQIKGVGNQIDKTTEFKKGLLQQMFV